MSIEDTVRIDGTRLTSIHACLTTSFQFLAPRFHFATPKPAVGLEYRSSTQMDRAPMPRNGTSGFAGVRQPVLLPWASSSPSAARINPASLPEEEEEG